MQLTLPERDNPQGRLALEQGKLAGRAYRLEPQICANPVCDCKTIVLNCLPKTPEEAASHTPLTLKLDLGRRILVKPGHDEIGPASELAEAVRREMTSEQWGCLHTYYYTVKSIYTESANLDELDTGFPSNASKGAMVGYYEILPFAPPIRFAAEGCEWAFDDQFCLRSDCACRAAILQCFRISPRNADAGPKGPNLSLRYHYDTRRIEDVENFEGGLSPETFLNSLRQAHPDFDAFLAERHDRLRHLYGLFLKRRRASKRPPRDMDDGAPRNVQLSLPEAARVGAPKPGRNDPCPCGSGKKYKKCCGLN